MLLELLIRYTEQIHWRVLGKHEVVEGVHVPLVLHRFAPGTD